MQYATPSSTNKTHYAIYECECGNRFKAMVHNVNKKNGTKSCGCVWNHKGRKHGLSNTRVYQIWTNMLSRCYKSSAHDYIRYGGAGIITCDEWKNDFMSFYNWSIDNGYKDNLTIDRKDNNKGYFPDNCRWVRLSDNLLNKRVQKNTKSGYKGVCMMHDGVWYSMITCKGVKHYLGRFKNIIDAARAYDEAAKKYHGAFAYLNFPSVD